MTVDINHTADSVGFGRNVSDNETTQAIFAWKTTAKDRIYIVNSDLETILTSIGWSDCIE